MQRSVPSETPWLRRLAALLFVLVTLAAIADSVMWFRLERALDRRLTAFADGAARAGWSLRAHRGQRGGWPFAATLRITGLRLAADRSAWPGQLEWSGDTVVLSLSPLHPALLHVSLPGTQSLQVGSLSLRSWGSGLELDSDGSRIAMSADALHLVRAGAGPDAVLQSAAMQAELHWRPDQPGGTDLAITLHQVAMPLPGAGEGRVAERARLLVTLDAPLARALDSSLVGALPGSPPRDDDAAPSFATMLSRWAHDGGAVRLEEASLDWPDAGLFLSGRLVPVAGGAFDGDLSLDLLHPERPLGVMRRAGAIGPGEQTAMLAVIGLVADGAGAPSPADGRIKLPLLLRGGSLRLGDIPLLTVPPL